MAAACCGNGSPMPMSGSIQFWTLNTNTMPRPISRRPWPMASLTVTAPWATSPGERLAMGRIAVPTRRREVARPMAVTSEKLSVPQLSGTSTTS